MPRLTGLLPACLVASTVAGATALRGNAQEDQVLAPDTGSPAVIARHQLPAGYLGIVFTCRLKSGWSPAGLAVIHYEYPAVASVQAESPAAHAGIEQGDTIVA